MSITNLTSVHGRFDPRVFYKISKSLSRKYITNLIVSDGLESEVVEGINIINVESEKRGRLRRIFFSSFKVVIEGYKNDSKIYHIHDPELLIPSLFLKLKGKKVIYDIHENIRVQILHKKWIPKLFRPIVSGLVGFVEDILCRIVDAVIVPQPKMLDFYKTRSKNVVLVANYPEVKLNKRDNIEFNPFNLIYSGAITEERGLFNMLDFLSCNDRYKLTLAGPITSTLLNLAKEHRNWGRVEYLGVLGRKELYERYKSSSVGLIMFNNIGQYDMAYSLKLFEYMQNGLIVVMPNFGEWVKFNKEYKAGFNIDYNDFSSTDIRLRNISIMNINEIKNNNFSLVNSKFSWRCQEGNLMSLYEELYDR